MACQCVRRSLSCDSFLRLCSKSKRKSLRFRQNKFSIRCSQFLYKTLMYLICDVICLHVETSHHLIELIVRTRAKQNQTIQIENIIVLTVNTTCRVMCTVCKSKGAFAMRFASNWSFGCCKWQCKSNHEIGRVEMIVQIFPYIRFIQIATQVHFELPMWTLIGVSWYRCYIE